MAAGLIFVGYATTPDSELGRYVVRTVLVALVAVFAGNALGRYVEADQQRVRARKLEGEGPPRGTGALLRLAPFLTSSASILAIVLTPTFIGSDWYLSLLLALLLISVSFIARMPLIRPGD